MIGRSGKRWLLLGSGFTPSLVEPRCTTLAWPKARWGSATGADVCGHLALAADDTNRSGASLSMRFPRAALGPW